MRYRSCLLRLAAAATCTTCLAAAPSGQARAAGEIYWFSLLSEDAPAAIGFYSELFGWEITAGPTGGYMALRDGVPFAGINQIEDRIPNESESLWLAAITVDDVGRALETARGLGATVHENVRRLEGWGTYALIQDPQGAPVSLVTPERVLGGTQGYSGWRWAELWTHDTDAARDFYTAVVGYQIEDLPLGEQGYTALVADGTRIGGLMKLPQPDVAPRWAPYVGVTDLRGILVRVWQLRGQVLREPAEIDFEAAGENRVALIADPTGGVLFLYQLDERASADPGVAAQTSRRSLDPTQSVVRTDGPNINVSVTMSYGYGFGGGWGTLYPSLPYRAFGPY